MIRSAPARLDNRPSEAPSSLVAAETVKTESVIDISDNASSDSDSDQKPPAKIINRKTISTPQMATNRTKATIPLESDSFSNPSSDKSDEVSSDSEEDTKPKAKPKSLSLYEQSRMKRVHRQERNEAKRKQILVTDNSNYRGPALSQMSANDSIKGKSLNFSAEVLVAAEPESRSVVHRPLGRIALPTRRTAAVARASKETSNEIKARASKRLEKNTVETAVVAAKPRPKAKAKKPANKAAAVNVGNVKAAKSKNAKANVAADRSPKRKKAAPLVNSPTPSMQLRSRNQERKEDKERANQLKKKQKLTEKKFNDLVEESSESTGGSTSS